MSLSLCSKQITSRHRCLELDVFGVSIGDCVFSMICISKKNLTLLNLIWFHFHELKELLLWLLSGFLEFIVASWACIVHVTVHSRYLKDLKWKLWKSYEAVCTEWRNATKWLQRHRYSLLQCPNKAKGFFFFSNWRKKEKIKLSKKLTVNASKYKHCIHTIKWIILLIDKPTVKDQI